MSLRSPRAFGVNSTRLIARGARSPACLRERRRNQTWPARRLARLRSAPPAASEAASLAPPEAATPPARPRSPNHSGPRDLLLDEVSKVITETDRCVLAHGSGS